MRPAVRFCRTPISASSASASRRHCSSVRSAQTYGLEMRDLFADLDRSISTYRYAVSQIIPTLTAAAWRDKHDEIAKLTPAIDRSAFVVLVSARRLRAGLRPRLSEPRILRTLRRSALSDSSKDRAAETALVQGADAEAAELFAQSFRDATARFRAEVKRPQDRKFEHQERQLRYRPAQPLRRLLPGRRDLWRTARHTLGPPVPRHADGTDTEHRGVLRRWPPPVRRARRRGNAGLRSSIAARASSGPQTEEPRRASND